MHGTNQILLTIGSITPRKGQVLVIKAMEYVINKYKNCHYLMVGIPNYGKQYLNIAKELGLYDNIHVLGKIGNQDIINILNFTDIYLLTSQITKNSEFEGFGISVIEAAFYGVPAIVTNTSGVAESVLDNNTGFSCNESPKEISKKIITLLDNKQLRINMGNNAKERANSQLTWWKKSEEYHQLVNEIIK